MGAGTVSPSYKWPDQDSWPPWKAGTGAVSTWWLRSLTLSYCVYSANIGFLPHARHRAGLYGRIRDLGWHHQGPQAAKPAIQVTERLWVSTESVSQCTPLFKDGAAGAGALSCLFLKRWAIFIQLSPPKSESQCSGRPAGFRAPMRLFPCPLPLLAVKKTTVAGFAIPGLNSPVHKRETDSSEKALRGEDGLFLVLILMSAH